jgi:antitoxin (DNA-binding transcriptional repressor) of toxin-antitoxin stability system
MAREITQRELRNSSGSIMRALDSGETFVVTRNGVPVGELVPLRARRFVTADAAIAAFGDAPSIAADQFRADIDSVLDHDPSPRA